MNEVSDQLGELRERASRLRRARDIAQEHGEEHALGAAQLELREIEQQIDLAQGVQQQLLRQVGGMGVRPFGETLFDDPNTLVALEAAANSSAQFGAIYGRVMDAEQLADAMSGGRMMAAAPPATLPPDSRLQAPYGVVPAMYRPLTLLSLIPVGVMVGLAFHFVAETGTTDFAAETAEGSTKPADTTLAYVENTVTAATIAAYQKVARQAISDAPWLQQNIQTRLMYGVNRRVEHEALLGDGTGANIRGILQTTGIGSIAFVAGTALSDLILEGITTVQLSNGVPNGIAINPTNYQQMLIAKASGSGERLDSDGAFTAPANTMWGLPLVVTSLVPANTAVVGDWARGCELFVREGLTIRISDSDQNDFLLNQVTLLAETRVGFAVFQPTAFCSVALA
jgi:HK97 family phage major capsid protein